jgi:hypothetical protein
MNSRLAVLTEGDAVRLGLRANSPTRPFAWPILAALLVAYVVAEIVFNLELVRTVAQAEIDRQRLDELVQFGKATGAFGLVLFVMRPFFARAWRRFGWGLPVAFVLAWGTTYVIIDHIYDRVLAQVPESIQREAVYLTVYRDALFHGMAANSELGDANGVHADSQRLALLNLAARLTGEKPEIASVKAHLGDAELALQAGLPVDARTQQMVARSKSMEPEILRDATAAILLPPMSMALSLFAIVANVAALAGLLLTVALRRRRSVRLLATILPVLAIIVGLIAAETPPFAEGSHNRALFSNLDERLGVLGWVWSRTVNGQSILLRLSEDDANTRTI